MKKIFIRFLPSFISVSMLFSCVAYLYFNERPTEITKDDTTETISEKSETSVIQQSSEQENSIEKLENSQEMRGIWIPYMSLTLSENERTKDKFQKKIDSIIENCKKFKANTIIVQVRPFGDAIYPSEIFPFSHIISGTQGKSVDYNPLEYIIEKAHENNISVHAWANLLRIKTAQTPSELSTDNPYIIWKNDNNSENDDYTFQYENGIYYNPAYPQVRKLIIDGISEIVSNYDVDGIQFDDYFYPSEDTDYDNNSYKLYCKNSENSGIPLSHSEWRKVNINTLISGIYSAIKSIRNDVVFGISPQGNIENDLLSGADVYEWCSKNGYIDYICPQIYVSNEHPILPFNNTADRWKNLVKLSDIKLYLGLGMYKAGTDADSGSWLTCDNNIQQQIEYGRKIGTDGFMIYSYEYLDKDETEKEVINAIKILD